MSPDENKKDVLREWRESAPYWAKHAGVVRSMFAPITRALVQAGRISEGHVVLDVAGGAGEPSISLSSVVGPSGSVIFTDAVAEMITTARAEAQDRELTHIEFTQCIAESMPFSSNTFDAVVCRLGIMLFSDPVGAIHEALRVVKSQGSVSYAVWSGRNSNPFFHIVMDVVSRYIESPPEDPNAPGAFRFTERGKLARLLADAGAIEVTEQLLEFELDAALTPAEFWALRVELSDTLRAKVAQLSRDTLLRVEQEVAEAGERFFASGRMKFPGEVLIVTGVKP